ncbi:hypothetical protein GCM10010532_042680 [Dactylosporangium siamense]|uniref:Uncharacterized protein n=1 Tax=Dactylosporangium siamense TaxID=685454 RepID=A0A919U722_9ACTN|nr:hypothetical protein Dsi01nite_031250 [Dactylosporangium siamense]
MWKAGDTPVSVEEATARYHDLCDAPGDDLVPGVEVAALVADVAAHLEQAGLAVDGEVWSATPSIGPDHAVMTMPWRSASVAVAFVPGLAVARGFVCYDPQNDRVHQHAAAAPHTGPSLQRSDGTRIDDPDDETIERTVLTLSRERWFAILHTADEGTYFQVGYGDQAAAPPGQYAVEHRDGSPDRHRRAVTPDRRAVAQAMREFRDGNGNWEKRFSWRSIQL